MEFSHEREVDNRFFYNEEEDELEDDDRDEQNPTKATDTTKLHPFIPIISSSSSISLNCEPSSTSTTQIIQKEHMFEKVVTPSDVGKLNRLVIPKQHAEKYFPLDASTHDRGLLLNFEDRNGKPWRFRYSYWNSSQSYVMTKGWSRFVKEKRLDAGDTVSFGRGTGGTAGHRLFIDWKRRPEPPHLNLPHFTSTVPSSAGHPHPYLSFSRSAAAPWAAGRLFVPHAAAAPAPAASNYFYFRSASGAVATRPNAVSAAGDTNGSMVLDSVPVSANGEPKRLRLFGVNLEQPYEAIDNNETSGLLRLQLRIGGHESSSSTAKDDSQHSPSFGLDMWLIFLKPIGFVLAMNELSLGSKEAANDELQNYKGGDG